jgi:hypothetical protein
MSSHSAIVAIRSALHVRTMTSAVLALAVVVGTHTAEGRELRGYQMPSGV